MTTPTIVDLIQTSERSPSQWEGALSNGMWLYVRYRHRELSIGVGAMLDEAIRASAVEDVEVTGAGESEASWDQVAPYVLSCLIRLHD
jgi:hypothetical protein